MGKAPKVDWTREHELVALNVYYKLPFGRYDKGNKLVIDVASKMGRTPSSLAMKLSNFASLDPIHKARGIKGLSGASQLDKRMWIEFHQHLDALGPESEQLLHDLYTGDETAEVDFLHRDRVRVEESPIFTTPTGPTESSATVKVRRGQQFFRQSILNVYDVRCCISGINIPRLLVASHIKPWKDFPDERLHPRNGLCLSNLHDAAFDSGLITIDEDFRVVLSKRLKSYLPQPSLHQNISAYEGKTIELPKKIAEPDKQYLAYHRDEVFKAS